MPLIARWPGQIPAGATGGEIVAGFDLFAPFADVGGAVVPRDRVIDGRSLLPLLKGEAGARSPHTAFFGVAGKQIQSAREGPWKIVLPAGKEKDVQLCNLDDDPGEKSDLAPSKPEIVDRLKGIVGKGRQNFQSDKALD